MELQEIGQQLKEARERKGLTLHDVHDKLKLSVHVLEAMEQGEESNLPHPVYTRGFIQEYARFLDLDTEEIVAAVDRLYQSELEEEDSVEIPSTLKVSSKPDFLSLALKIAAGLLLIAVVGGIVWFLLTPFFGPVSDRDTATGSGAEAVGNASAGKYTEDKGPKEGSKEPGKNVSAGSRDREETNGTPSRLETAADLANATAVDESGVRNAGNFSASAGTGAEISPGNNTEDNPLPEEDDFRIMEIMASKECWVLADLDGTTQEYYLRPGDTVELRFEDTLRLRLGNSGGVSLVLDGREYPFEGETNQVRTITIGDEG